MGSEKHKENFCLLQDMPLGIECSVVELEVTGFKRRRLLDLGLVPSTKMIAIRRSPFGDPTAYLVRRTVVALRQEDSSRIIVRKSDC